VVTHHHLESNPKLIALPKSSANQFQLSLLMHASKLSQVLSANLLQVSGDSTPLQPESLAWMQK
jgi:hypothetical protein